MEKYTASLIVVGDEILRGQVTDTNTSYLAKNLRTIGVRLQSVIVVPDVMDDISNKIRVASSENSIVFTSGGSGPTHDDVTYEAVAKAFKLKLELNKELLDVHTRMNPDQLEIKRLAIVPNPCEIINVNATNTCVKENFPVIKVKNVYVLSGSPKYFEAAVDTIIPQLKKCTQLYLEYVDIKLNELSIVRILDKLAKRWDNQVKIGSYPQLGPQPFTRIALEGYKKEYVSRAKEELLFELPIQKFINVEPKFGYLQMDAILNDRETYIECAVNTVINCYNSYKSDEIFISFNGGKDCTAVLHLAAAVANSRASPLLCFYVAGDAFPEVEEFLELASRYYNLEIIRKLPPIQSALFTLLEEKPNLKACLMGMRKDDPSSANLQSFTYTDRGWPSLIRVNPILYWSYNQVWKFLLKHKVPYCTLYDQGYTSIGSRKTTLKNPLLKDPNDPSSYLPAYTLTDKTAERRGRL